MKKQILTLFFIISTTLVFSQILIPFKKGDKFGLSDTNGRIVVKPIYDNFDIARVHNNYKLLNHYFLASKNDTSYLYKNDQFILSGYYDQFQIFADKYIKAKTKKSWTSEYLYDLKGNKINIDIIPENNKIIIEAFDDTTLVKFTNLKNSCILTTRNAHLKLSLWVFDTIKNNIETCIISNIGGAENIHIETLKNKKYLIISGYFEPDQMIKSKFAISLSKEQKFIIVPYEQLLDEKQKAIEVKKNQNAFGSVSQEGEGEELQEAEFATAPDQDYPNYMRCKKGSIKYSFITKNKNLYFQTCTSKNDENYSDCKYDTVLTQITDKKILSNYTITNLYWNSSKQNFYNKELCKQDNIVIFQNKGKKGLLLTDNLIIPANYDTIRIIDNGHFQILVVGVLDEETNKLKFGLSDLKGVPITDIAYDKIDVDVKSKAFITIKPKNNIIKSSNFNEFEISQNNKRGIINSAGKIIIPPLYDSIIRIEQRFDNSNFFVIKNQKWGGLHHSDFKLNALFIEPNFPRPYYILSNYDGVKDLTVLYFDQIDGAKTNFYGLPSGKIFYEP